MPDASSSSVGTFKRGANLYKLSTPRIRHQLSANAIIKKTSSRRPMFATGLCLQCMEERCAYAHAVPEKMM